MASPVQADGIDIGFDAVAGDREATVTVDAEHSTSTPGSRARQVGRDTTSAATRTCTYLGVPVDCTSDRGDWVETRQCYVQRMAGEVTEDSPYEGHTDGAVYRCATPGSPGGGLMGVGAGSLYLFWAPSPQAAGLAELVDPVTLAERAVEQMGLVAPVIGMTPLEPGAPLLVGMDAWLWVDNDGPRASGPITRSATAGPVSVTATAQVTQVVWDMGDGTRVTCRDAGTPWSPERGTGPSPSCGHRYLTPSTSEADGSFTVRATAHWQVEWSGAGQSGEITFSMTGTRDILVTELQVLQTG